MDDIVQVQVIFSFTQDGKTLNDALYFSIGEYLSMVAFGTLDSTIARMQQERFDNWIAALNASPVDPQPEE